MKEIYGKDQKLLIKQNPWYKEVVDFQHACDLNSGFSSSETVRYIFYRRRFYGSSYFIASNE